MPVRAHKRHHAATLESYCHTGRRVEDEIAYAARALEVHGARERFGRRGRHSCNATAEGRSRRACAPEGQPRVMQRPQLIAERHEKRSAVSSKFVCKQVACLHASLLSRYIRSLSVRGRFLEGGGVTALRLCAPRIRRCVVPFFGHRLFRIIHTFFHARSSHLGT